MFCELFGYSKQAYYKHCVQYKAMGMQRLQAKDMVLNIRQKMPRLGTRKLHHMLKDVFAQRQIKLGRDALFSLLRKEGLLVGKLKKYTATTHSKHWLRKYPNLIKELKLVRPEQLWVADITYVESLEGFKYLHLITDAYSKQIMGFELCNDMEASSTLKGLQMALNKRQYPEKELIHHSDRGLQYCSKLYSNTLIKNNIKISMTENGDPYENAIAERVNGILKDEFGLGDTFEDLGQCQQQTKQSIDIYNTMRPHLSCGMLTPLQMHKQSQVKIKTWHKKTSNTYQNV